MFLRVPILIMRSRLICKSKYFLNIVKKRKNLAGNLLLLHFYGIFYDSFNINDNLLVFKLDVCVFGNDNI